MNILKDGVEERDGVGEWQREHGLYHCHFSMAPDLLGLRRLLGTQE